MRRRYKFLIAIVALLSLSWVATQWAKRSPWLSERLLTPIQTALSQATGRPIALQGVGGGLSGWIWLQGVGIGPDPAGKDLDLSVTAQAIGLRFGVLNLIRGRTDLSALQALRVEEPKFYLLRRARPEGLSPAAQPGDDWRKALQGFPLPALSLDLRSGEAYLQTAGQAPEPVLSGLEADLKPDAQGWRLEGRLDLAAGGRVGLWGRSRADMSGAQLKARVSRLPLTAVTARIDVPAWLKVTTGQVEGDLDLSQGAEGLWKAQGKGELNGATLLLQGREGLSRFEGRWSWDGSALGLDAIHADCAQGALEGKLLWRPGLGLSGSLDLRKAALGPLAQALGAPQGLSLSGQADAQWRAMGAGSPDDWTLGLKSAQASWAGQSLQRLELRAQATGLSVSADCDMAWDGGEGKIRSAWGPAGLESAELDAQAVPAAWCDAWLSQKLQGRVDAHGQWRPQVDQQPWELVLHSPQMGVGKLQLTRAQLSASGDALQAQARLEADLGEHKGMNAQLEATADAGAWILQRVRVFEKDQLRIDAEGRYQAPTLSLQLHKAQVPLALTEAWLPEALQGLSGSVQAKGELRWMGTQAGGSLKLQAPSLTQAGVPMAASAHLDFSANGVTLSALDLRQGELQGSLSADRWAGPWDARLELHRAQAGAWLAMVGAPQGLSGTVDGRVSLRGSSSLSARLHWDAPWEAELPGASLDMSLERSGSQWSLKRFALLQGDGRLEAQGALDPAQASLWSGQAHWSRLTVHGRAFNGEARLSPGSSGPVFNVGPWDVSGTALPALDAALSLQGQRVMGVVARVGAESRLSARRADNGWLLRADLAGQDPALLAGPWLGRRAQSTLRLNGWVEARTEPAAEQPRWSLQLSDAAAAASRFSAEGEVLGWAPAQAQWKAWDLGRSNEALDALGLTEGIHLQGLSNGSLRRQAGGVSISAEASDLRVGSLALGPAELRGSWDGQNWALASLKAGSEGPRVALSAWRGHRSATAWDAQGRLDLTRWPAAIFELDGSGQLTLQGSDQVGSLRSQWSRLSVSERAYQKVGVDLDWDHGTYKLTASPPKPVLRARFNLRHGFELEDLQAQVGKGKASLHGRVAADGALQFDGQAQGFPAGELTAWLGWPQAWTGAAYGSLKLSGSETETRGIISVKIEDGSVAGLPFDLASGLVHLEPGWVQLSPLGPIRLSRRGGVALEVTGKVPLEREKGIEPEGLEVDANLIGGGLGLLAGSPLIEAASGPLDLALHFRGRRDDPDVSGQARITDGALTPTWLLPPLAKVELFAQIEHGQVELQRAEARVQGDGPLLKLETLNAARPAFTFERWLPAAFNLRLRSSRSGIPLRSTQALAFIDGQAHPDLRLSGSWGAPLLEGSLSLDKGSQDKAVVQWPPRFAKGGAGADDGSGFLDSLRFSLRLLARQDVMVRTEAAQVFVDSGEAGLLLTGAGAERELEGHLKFTRGSIDYLLASFQLATDKDTYLDFRPGSPPELELWGLKRVRDALLNGETQPRDVDVRLHAYGPIGSVQMRLESDDPGLDQQQLASLTGLGVDISDPRSQGGFARLLGKVPARFLTDLVRRTGMVDEVGVRLPVVEDALAGSRTTPVPGEPSGQSISSTGRTLVSVDAGKYLGEKLYVGVTGQINERDVPGGSGKTEVDPAVGGKVEYKLKDNSLLSAQHSVATDGQTEQRVMLERSSRFDNYNPRRRRWDLMAKPSLSPSPTPRPPLQPIPR